MSSTIKQVQTDGVFYSTIKADPCRRQGHRHQIAAWMRKAPQQHGIAVISADYRFAPQVHVKEIVEDVKDCIVFIRTSLALQLDDKIDGSRLAVSGSSAGGYLALFAGLYVDPKPNVILPIYPITDPLGWFFITPDVDLVPILVTSNE